MSSPVPPAAPAYLNLGIVAHVDAGKTSLTERLLYEAGVLDAPGSVDAGTTRTDAMELERRRGITIRASVATFPVADLLVNLLDTPGHPDFIAEVERSLAVLDAAVLVLSAVEGVQPQTVVIWRALRRIGVPTLLFVNKVDRSGADVAAVVEQIRRRLAPTTVPLARCRGEGRHDAVVTGIPLTDEATIAAVAEVDERVLADWVDGRQVRRRHVVRGLRAGVRRGELTPVLCGSAVTGAGTEVLRAALTTVLAAPRGEPGRNSGHNRHDRPDPLAATVFAVDRDSRGRRAWLRLWAGELRLRDRIVVAGRRPEPVTELAVSTTAGLTARRASRAGEIAVVRGPAARVGDTVGIPPRRRTHRFAPASLEALVEPEDPARRSALFAGLAELADEDPLIALRLDRDASEAAVSLHGEVQKEVIAALLEERYGVRARFLATSVVCVERVVGRGSAVERIGADGNPYLAGIGLRVEAAAEGAGVRFSPGVERGNLPRAFVDATEEGVCSALRQGLAGWAVVDCTVTMTESGYCPRQSRPHQKFDKSISSVAADFRLLAPVVVTSALAAARTRVCQPVDRFELELPDTSLSAVTRLVGRSGGVVLSSLSGDDAATTDGTGYTRLAGNLPAAAVPDLTARLPDLTGGEGVLTHRLDHYAPVSSATPPTRRRIGPDPGDRDTWFRERPR
ncbi:MAG: GTP-binding protein [Dermatophilaceae bacterium]